MGAPTQTFTSARSIETLDLLDAVLKEMGRATIKQLCVRVNLSPSQTSLYILEMQRTGRAHCSRKTSFFEGGTTPKEWSAGPAPIGTGTRPNADLDRRAIVRQTWAPHHARDPLHCLLFGAPAALAVAA